MVGNKTISTRPPGILLVPIDPVERFIMGKDAYGREKQHLSSVPFRFDISSSPITNSEYSVFLEDVEGYRESRWWNFSREAKEWKHENPSPPLSTSTAVLHPRVDVTWFEAVAFCRWLSHKTNESYRLPTDAEWELVARGTDGRLYPWGNETQLGRCNSSESRIGSTSPVAMYDCIDYPYAEVYDLLGNVHEWLWTQWADPYPYSWRDRRNSVTGSSPRVARGGSFRWSIYEFDATTRTGHAPFLSSDDLGFRVVRVASDDLYLAH